jgi:hypothetical protein
MAKVQGTTNPTKPAKTGQGPYNGQLITPGQPSKSDGYLGRRVTPKGPGGYPSTVSKGK